jgi:hypothetical protein
LSVLLARKTLLASTLGRIETLGFLVHVDKIRSLRLQCNLGRQKCHESLDPSALPHCLTDSLPRWPPTRVPEHACHFFFMPAPRSTAKAAPVPSSTRPGRKQTALERENSARKREALERFVDKNAKVLAELVK